MPLGDESSPCPKAEMKLPSGKNFSTRALPLSTTKTLPLEACTATPRGDWNCPAPAPGVPKLLIGLNNDACAVAAPSANVKAPTAKAILATRGGPTPPRRQRATRLAVSVLPATGSTKRDRLMRASSPPRLFSGRSGQYRHVGSAVSPRYGACQ